MEAKVEYDLSKVLLLVMLASTVIYVGVSSYMTSTRGSTGPVCIASRYVGTTSTYYTPERLGIMEIEEYGNGSTLFVTFESRILSLPANNPVFKYKDAFYQINIPSAIFLPGRSKPIPIQPILIGGLLVAMGWLITLVVFLKKQKGEQTDDAEHSQSIAQNG
ncbi:hypothetical protein KEJ15_02195 [Candidatus Bathyarchaeota archaeon]|nr:hypothetical protein [Candidatus Bathyarchaeota archaeon]